MERGREKQRVKTGRGRSVSSTRWLQRQLNDPYVAEAQRRGFRARSVFKLEEIDRRFRLFGPGQRVLDLGAAPGSWTQYAVQRGCEVLAIDLLEMQPVGNARILQLDFMQSDAAQRIEAELGGGVVDVVLSDIAADATGQRALDRLRAEAVGEAVLALADDVLAAQGSCLVKLVRGAESALIGHVRDRYRTHRLLRPEATRRDSSEIFLLAQGRKT